MDMRKPIVITLTAVFVLSNCVFAAELKPKDITVPKQYGSVIETWQPNTATAQPLVIHIQSAHSHYEAHKNIEEILRHIIEEYGLWTVMIEGGFDGKEYSAAQLRNQYTDESLEQATEELLKEGEIIGPMALTATADYGTQLLGIENRKLYDDCIRAFLKIDNFKAVAVDLVKNLQENVANIKERLYPDTAKALEEAKKAYDNETSDLKAYLAVLQESGVGLGGRKDLATYLKVLELEKGVDFDKVNTERTDTVSKLTSELEGDELDAVFDAGADFRSGKISQGAYYTILSDLSKKHTETTPQELSKYTEYISLYETVDTTALFKQIDAAYDEALNGLLENAKQKKLARISKSVNILATLVDIRLTPDEYEYLDKNLNDFDVAGWVDELNGISGERLPQSYSLLDSYIPRLKDFYMAARVREEAMFKNTLKLAAKYKRPVVALHTGGFHTPYLTEMFRQGNVPYVVVSPKITTKMDTDLYHRVLRESWTGDRL